MRLTNAHATFSPNFIIVPQPWRVDEVRKLIQQTDTVGTEEEVRQRLADVIDGKGYIADKETV